MTYTKKYKASLYNIYVRLDDAESDYLLVHGYTGAVDHVSESVAQFLRTGNFISLHEIDQGKAPFSKNTFETLIQRGYLTDKSPNQEREWVKHMAELFHKRSKQQKNFLFLVAYDCNFRCPYCFENTISNNGKGWSKKVFTKQAADRAFEAMLELEPERKLHNNKITLYGGEPLLRENREIVDYIVAKGKEKGYIFNAITNGYDLQHYKHILNPGSIRRLQISLDGTREKHNNRRTHFRDGATYDTILENIQMALDQEVKVVVRINTDLNNFSDLKEINAEFKAKGFFEYQNFTVYSALIHGDQEMNCNAVMQGNDEPQKASKPLPEIIPEPSVEPSHDPDQQFIDFQSEQDRYVQQSSSKQVIFHDESFAESDKIHTINRGKYMRLYQEAVAKDKSLENISCQDFNIRSKIKRVLEGKGLMTFRSTFCGAQNGMMIFDPYGDLYTCWETVGMDAHKVGRYRDGLQLDEAALEQWYGRNISKTPGCKQCKYAFFCGGGCVAHALREGRGYNSPYCDGYAKTFHMVVPDVYNSFTKTPV